MILPASEPPARFWPRFATGPLAAAVVLAAFWVLMLASLLNKSLTCDEAIHMAGGYTYWKFNDYRFQPENGNLPQRVAALPLVLGGCRFPLTDSRQLWEVPLTSSVCYVWFHKMGNDAASMLLSSRAVCGLLAVALGALVWWWSRRLFGPWGGLLSLLLYVLNPTVLANGALVNSDMASALFFLASTLGLWAVLHRLTVLRVLLSALVLGGLFVTKTSAFLMLPVALTLMIARLGDGRPLPVGGGGAAGRELTRRGGQALAFAAVTAVHAVVVVIIIWAAYGFRYTACAQAPAGGGQHAYTEPWESVLGKPVPSTLLAQLNLSPAQQAGMLQVLKDHAAPSDWWTRESLEALQIISQTVLSPAQARKLDELRSAPPRAPVARILEFVNRHELLPEAYVYGTAYVWKSSRERFSFLNGEYSPYGWKSFFPYTFLVKTPLPLLAVIGLALAAAIARWRTGVSPVVPGLFDPMVGRSLRDLRFPPGIGGGLGETSLPQTANRISKRPNAVAPPGWRPAGGTFYETLPLWTLLAFYWAMVIPSHLNIGHRHILPTYPPMFVLCGCAVYWLEGLWKFEGRDRAVPAGRAARTAGVALCGLLAALAAEMFYRFPNYLSYFNGIVSPAQGYRHLVDSSLDWGQDLPGVKRYLDEHPPAGPVYLAYFGNASPDYYQIAANRFYANPRWDLLDSPLLRTVPPSGEGEGMRADLRRRFPDCDFIGMVREGGNQDSCLLLKKPALLRLRGGTYFISATLLQPVIYGPKGLWNERYEASYQKLYKMVKPLLVDDAVVRLAALNRFPLGEWRSKLELFGEYRFARLAACLRQREPDDNVNYSILIYRLTDADLARALEGPAPELGSLEAAGRHYEEEVRRQPDSSEAHDHLGEIFSQTGRLREAEIQYEQSLRLRPDDADARYGLANILVQTGRMEKAKEQYEQVLRLKPDHAGAHNNLGSVLLQMGRATEAIAHYEQALRSEPGYADAHHNLGSVLLQAGRLEEAREHLEAVVRLQPDSAGAHGSLGNVLARLGRTAEAIEQYEQTLRLSPDYAPARKNLERLRAMPQPGGSGN